MHRLAIGLVTTIAAMPLVLTAPTIAYADGWGDVNCTLTPDDPRCTVEVIYLGGGGGNGGSNTGKIVCKVGGVEVPCRSGSGWLGSDGCWYDKDAHGFLPPNYWIRTCWDPDTDTFTSWGTVYLPKPPGALGLLTDRAIDRLAVPRPVVAANPSLTATQVVHVPVWWWVQPGSWQTQTAQASAGGLTITARAIPKKITWHAGDGTNTECTGPGTPWTPRTNPTTASPTCGHTYTATSAKSPGGKFKLTAVATWEISWSGSGLNGSIPNVTTTTTVDVTVTELRAVITG